MKENLSLAEKLKNFLKNQKISKEVLAIYLYGSGVKERLRADSDIDIAFLPKRKIGINRTLSLIGELEVLIKNFLYSIGEQDREVSVYNMRKPQASLLLLYEILTSGIPVYITKEKRGYGEYLEFLCYVIDEYELFKPFYEKNFQKILSLHLRS